MAYQIVKVLILLPPGEVLMYAMAELAGPMSRLVPFSNRMSLTPEYT